MAKKVYPEKIKKGQRHVIWNSQQSPANPERIRHYFFIVGKNDVEKVRARLLNSVSSRGIAQYPIEIITERHYRKKGSKMDYILLSIDGNITPERISLWKLSYAVKQNEELAESSGKSIEKYLKKEYRLS